MGIWAPFVYATGKSGL